MNNTHTWRSPLDKLILIIKIFWITYRTMILVQNEGDPKDPKNFERIRSLEKAWATKILKYSGVTVFVTGEKPTTEPCLFAPNHVGFLDIPVIKGLVDASFVAKKEVRRWFVFGKASASVRTVFVDRSSPESRKMVSEEVGRFIKEEHRSVNLFPEGTSSLMGKDWKRGSFIVAQKMNILVQPVRIAFRPLRPAAYIDKDNFVVQLWKLLSYRSVEAHIHFFQPRYIKDADVETSQIQKMVQEDFKKLISSWDKESSF